MADLLLHAEARQSSEGLKIQECFDRIHQYHIQTANIVALPGDTDTVKNKISVFPGDDIEQQTIVIASRYGKNDADPGSIDTTIALFDSVHSVSEQKLVLSSLYPLNVSDEYPAPKCIFELTSGEGEEDHFLKMQVNSDRDFREELTLLGFSHNDIEVLQGLELKMVAEREENSTHIYKTFMIPLNLDNPILGRFASASGLSRLFAQIETRVKPKIIHRIENMFRREKISRRSIMTGAAKIGALMTIGATTGIPHVENERASEHFEEHMSELTQEEREMMNEIAQYRKGYGLEPVPYELSVMLQGVERPPISEKEKLQNKLPAYNTACGIVAQDTANLLFGERSKNVVHSVEEREENPYAISFRGEEEKTLSIPVDMHRQSRTVFDQVLLHEFGHAIDPRVTKNVYNLREMIRAEHGKWKAVSMANQFDGLFFKHKNDLTLVSLAKNIGRAVAVNCQSNSVRAFCGASGEAYIHNLVKIIANKHYGSVDKLVFNDETIEQIGRQVVAEVQKQPDIFDGELMQLYVSGMEDACQEQWAELMRVAILEPELIGNNHTVMSGVNEVLTLLHGQKIDLTDLRKQLMQRRHADIFDEEERLFNANKEGSLDMFTSKAYSQYNLDVEQARNAWKAFEKKNSLMSNFFDPAQTVEFDDKISQKYVDSCRRFLQAYPEASKAVLDASRSSINSVSLPFLDAHISLDTHRQLEQATDVGLLWRIFSGKPLDNDTYDRIKRNQEVLDSFIKLHDARKIVSEEMLIESSSNLN